MRDISISHKPHPARQSKSITGFALIKYCLATNRSLCIGTSDVDALYERIKFEYPEAKLSKHEGYVLVERGEE